MEQYIHSAVERRHAQAAALSDDLAAHPEVAGEEVRSSQKIVDILREAGYEVEYPYLDRPTGFRGVLKNGEGPTVGILVEYDALPGIGHACGHCVHGSMSVLAALAMADLRDKFHGTVYVYGTPAEETDGAKVGMAAKGAFDGLDLAVMIHSWSGGAGCADMDLFSLRCYEVEFRGKSAHAAAAPWDGHSALAAARKFLDLIDARRECFTPDVRVNSVISDGGRRPNIIPDRAEVVVEFRTASMSALQALDETILKCARAAAMALDCQVSWKESFDGFADMVRVPALEDAAEDLFTDLGLPVAPVQAPNGSSDMGNVSYRCPAIQPLLSICDAPYALHTPEFRDETTKAPAHAAIADGAKLITALALRVLTDEAFRNEVRAGYETALAKKTA